MKRTEGPPGLSVQRSEMSSLVVLATTVATGVPAAMATAMGVAASTERFASTETMTTAEVGAAVGAFSTATEQTAGVAAAKAFLRMSSAEEMKSVGLAGCIGRRAGEVLAGIRIAGVCIAAEGLGSVAGRSRNRFSAGEPA
jgi:hypothetical protein